MYIYFNVLLVTYQPKLFQLAFLQWKLRFKSEATFLCQWWCCLCFAKRGRGEFAFCCSQGIQIRSTQVVKLPIYIKVHYEQSMAELDLEGNSAIRQLVVVVVVLC